MTSKYDKNDNLIILSKDKMEIPIIKLKKQNDNGNLKICTYNINNMSKNDQYDKVTEQQNKFKILKRFQEFNKRQASNSKQFDIVCLQEHKLIGDQINQCFKNQNIEYNRFYKTFVLSAVSTGQYINSGESISINKDLIDNEFNIRFYQLEQQLSQTFQQNYLQQGRVQFILLEQTDKQYILIANIYQQTLYPNENLISYFSEDEQVEIFNKFEKEILKNYDSNNDDKIINIIKQMISELKIKTKLYNDDFQTIIIKYINMIINDQQANQQLVNQYINNDIEKYSKYLTDYIINTIEIFMMQGNQLKNMNQKYIKQKDINYNDILYDRKNEGESIFVQHTQFLLPEQRTQLKENLFQEIIEQIQRQFQDEQMNYELQKRIVDSIVQEKDNFKETINDYVQEIYEQNKTAEDYFQNFYIVLFQFIFKEIIEEQREIQRKNFYKELEKIIEEISKEYNCQVIICGDLNVQYKDFKQYQTQLKDYLDVQEILQQEKKDNIQIDFNKINYKGYEDEENAKQRRQNIRLDYVLIKQNRKKQVLVPKGYHLYDSYTEKIRQENRYKYYKRDHDPLVVNICIQKQQQNENQQIDIKNEQQNKNVIQFNTPSQSVIAQDNIK